MDDVTKLRIENLKLKLEIRKTRLTALASMMENIELKIPRLQDEIEVLTAELEKVQRAPNLTSVG